MKLNIIVRNILMLLVGLMLTSASLLAQDRNILAYKDRGIKYYPKYVKKGVTRITKASWYGKPFHGRLTANGERYNMYKMTAAHRTYAMNTILKVTNLANKRSVKVRINDRGPFYSSRKIDLSYGAARKLGMIDKGVGKVKIEVISSHEKAYKKKKKNVIKSKMTEKKTKNIINQNIKRTQQIQVASFFNKKNADNFTQEHHLKNVLIIKKYIKPLKKTAYRVVVLCTPWEAKILLESKKFTGAYLVS